MLDGYPGHHCRMRLGHGHRPHLAMVARLESELEATGGIAPHALELNRRDGSSVPAALAGIRAKLAEGQGYSLKANS